MKVTLSVLKADIGSVGGHTLPSRKVLAKVEEVVREEVGRLLLDAYVFHIGDDIVLLLSHTRGVRNQEVHALAWKAFREGTEVARAEGLYGAGQDLRSHAIPRMPDRPRTPAAT